MEVPLKPSTLLKFIYSEKAKKFCEISAVLQIYGGDFPKFYGLLRIYEFYKELMGVNKTPYFALILLKRQFHIIPIQLCMYELTLKIVYVSNSQGMP